MDDNIVKLLSDLRDEEWYVRERALKVLNKIYP